MNDRLPYFEIMIAMILIALGLSVMTVPWLGPRALLLGLGSIAAIVLGLRHAGTRPERHLLRADPVRPRPTVDHGRSRRGRSR